MTMELPDAYEAPNPFEAFADAYTPRPMKRRRERHISRGPVPKEEKRREERNRLAARYRNEEARRVAEALSSPLGRKLADLLAGFDRLSIDDADRMIDTVAAQGWLIGTDREFRQLALRLIDRRIARIRRDAGLPDLDDPLPGEPESAFLILKRLLKVT
jgi:hypothetical protein